MVNEVAKLFYLSPLPLPLHTSSASVSIAKFNCLFVLHEYITSYNLSIRDRMARFYIASKLSTSRRFHCIASLCQLKTGKKLQPSEDLNSDRTTWLYLCRCICVKHTFGYYSSI